MPASAFKVRGSEKPSEAALREARARWGAKAHIRASELPSSPQARDGARREVADLKARKTAIDKEITDRLAQLDWYIALTSESRALYQQINQRAYYVGHTRCAVGRHNGIGFEVLGSGDSWAEAFTEADRRNER